jgi:hypothetical protein
MKLQLLAIVVSLLSPTTAALLLSLSLPNSVSVHKKTSPTGWLPLPQTQHLSPHISFSPHAPLSRTPHSLQFTIQTPSSF